MQKPKRRRWRRRLLYLGIFILLLPVILLGVGQAIIASKLNPEWLVLRIEKSRNCRAEVGSCSANLFGFPAYLEIGGLKLIPRDKAANQGNLLSARSKVQLTHTGISAERVRLEINPWALLIGRVSIGDTLMTDVDIRGTEKDGVDSLKELLARAPEPVVEGAPPPETPETPAEPEKDRRFKAKSLPLPVTFASLTIERGRFTHTNRKKKRDLQVEDFTLKVGSFEIHPKDLHDGNKVHVTLSGRFQHTDRKIEPANRQADLRIAVRADIQPFDPATGLLTGNLDTLITVQQGSSLNQLPSLVKLAGRMTKLRDRVGLDLTKLPTSGTLIQDAPLHVVFQDGLATFRDDTWFVFDTWNLCLKDGSWVTGGEKGHQFNGVILPTKADTDRALADLDAFLRPQSPGIADKAKVTVTQRLVAPDSGRLSLPFTSTGDIGKPEVKVAKDVEKVFYDLLVEVGTSGDELDDILNLIQKNRDSKESKENEDAPEKTTPPAGE